MQVLHLHWQTPNQPGQHGRFLFWAETAVANPPSRDRRKKTAQSHPFAADTPSLRALLKKIGWAGKLPAEVLSLWLPTNRLGPLTWYTIGKPMQIRQNFYRGQWPDCHWGRRTHWLYYPICTNRRCHQQYGWEPTAVTGKPLPPLSWNCWPGSFTGQSWWKRARSKKFTFEARW